jgi:hypothetical protein
MPYTTVAVRLLPTVRLTSLATSMLTLLLETVEEGLHLRLWGHHLRLKSDAGVGARGRRPRRIGRYVAGSRPQRNDLLRRFQPRNVSVALAWGSHPFPSRTRPLSPTARMVLPGSPGGRVRRRRLISRRPPGPARTPAGVFHSHPLAGFHPDRFSSELRQTRIAQTGDQRRSPRRVALSLKPSRHRPVAEVRARDT